MARPSGNETVLRDIDAFTMQLGRGVMAGLQNREQRMRDEQARAFTRERDTFQRSAQTEDADLRTAQERIALGHDLPQQRAPVEARLGPQRPALAAAGREALYTRGAVLARQARPVQLVPSDERRRMELDAMGGGPMQPGPTVGEQVAPVARGVADALELPLGQVDALGDFVPTRAAPMGELPDPNASLKADVMRADIEAKKARAARDRRPPQPRVTRGTPPPDDRRLVLERMDKIENEWKTTMQQSQAAFKEGVEARAKTVAGGSPSIEQMKIIEDAVALPLLKALDEAGILSDDILIPKNAEPGAYSAALNAAHRTQFDREWARSRALQIIKSLDAPDAFPRSAPNPAAGSTPPRNVVESAARAIAKERGIAWDRLNDPDMADKASEIMREAINRAATPQ